MEKSFFLMMFINFSSFAPFRILTFVITARKIYFVINFYSHIIKLLKYEYFSGLYIQGDEKDQNDYNSYVRCTETF
jgi:hypothetical protein